MNRLSTKNEIKNFLLLRNKRVRLEETTFHGVKKHLFFVAGRDYHFFNKVVNEAFPMGVLVETRRLKVWQCRFKKIQLPKGY